MMESEFGTSFNNRREDELTYGQTDPGQDNALHQISFLGAGSETDEEHLKQTTVAVNQKIPTATTIKRPDPVSPQVADAVETVLNQSESTTQNEFKNVPTTPRDSIAYPLPDKIELQRGPENFPLPNGHTTLPQFPSKYDLSSLRESFGNFKKSLDKSESSQNGHHSPLENTPIFPAQPPSSESIQPSFGRSLSSNLENSGHDDSKINSFPQRSPSVNASFHDNNSSSSESSFYNPNPGKFQSYSTDPTTGIVKYTPNKEGVFFCHLCSFSGSTRKDFEDHMTCHFEHICPHCDYKSRTEGRLKRHIKDFHTDDPPEGFGSKRNMGRPKVFRCKQCSFESTEKTLFWQHAKTHIKEEKLLQCPRCEFVTEYKHHLEYHLRNHFGSKPFKCSKCNYSCVNKSMLNSHMKSHTNVYQYRCADCTYATKYCHSLKLHLRKYNHKPATVLNNDGSLPQGIDAEASGLSLLQKRGPPRGPRGPRKDKFDPFAGQFPTMIQGLPGMPGMPGFNGGMMPPFWPLMRQLPGGMPGGPPPLVPTSLSSPFPHLSPHSKLPPASPLPFGMGMGSMASSMKCNFCSFKSDVKQELYRHVMKVHAAENQDLFSIFGISSEALLEEQNRRLAFLKQQISPVPNSDKSHQFSPGLQIKTEIDCHEPMKSSPHSWPRQLSEDGSSEKLQRSGVNRYNLPEIHGYQPYLHGDTSPREADGPEGEDIIKQMMNKFGAGAPIERLQTASEIPSENSPQSRSLSPEETQRECPLDLTKPRTPSPVPQLGIKRKATDTPTNEVEVSSSAENSVTDMPVQSPRKRSRKGKAFKLETLCLKLQEKQSDSPFQSENGEDSDNMEEEDDLHIEESENKQSHVSNKWSDESKNDHSLEDENANDVEKEMRGHDNNFADEGEEKTKDDNVNGEVKDDPEKSQEMDESYMYDPSLEQVDPEEFMADMNKRKQLPQAVRRGTELAWKILQDTNPGINIPTSDDPTQDEDSPQKTFPRSADQMALAASTPIRNGHPQNWKYECPFCTIAFKDCVIYTMHMGYHGYRDPFKCNMCGYQSRDKVEFFLHIARDAHN